MLIYLVRHGETRSNEEGYFQGWTDDPLNSNGILLAEITGKGMRDIRFDVCISSPLLRAKQTAEIILRESGNDMLPIRIDERIKEINAGDWEMKKFRPGERDSVIDEHLLNLFFSDTFRFSAFPGGESIRRVCLRTQDFLKSLTAKDDGKSYLVVTHGLALRSMLNCFYDEPEDFWHGHVPYNCSVSIIEAKNDCVRLVADDIIFYDKAYIVDRYGGALR